MALTWTIDSMTVDKLQDGLTDVVTFVQWRLVGEDGTYVDPEYSGETVPNVASVYGSLRVGQPNPDDFTPYADLTESAVLTWVHTKFDSEMVPSKNPDDPEEMISKTEGLNGAKQSLAQIERTVNRIGAKVDTHGERLASVEAETANIKERLARRAEH